MRPEIRKLVWDALAALKRIRVFSANKTLSDYVADELLSSAVERQFEIVGEALSKIAKLDPHIADGIPEWRRIVGFRNLLIHGYATIDHNVVWGVVQSRVPELQSSLEDLMAN